MKRTGLSLLLFFFTLPLAFGQFRDLATTDDGAQLYFSSTLRLRGANQYGHAKIFRYVDGELQLFEQRERLPYYYGNKSNYFALISPSVSGGGTAVGLTGTGQCFGGSSCVFYERYQGSVRRNGVSEAMTFPGRAAVSRNGRYVLQFGGTGYLPPEMARVRLHDLEAGTALDLAGGNAFWPSRQPLASDGTVLFVYDDVRPFADHHAVRLRRGDQTASLPYSKTPSYAVVNDFATHVAYESVSLGERNLFLIDVILQRESFIASGPRIEGADPSDPHPELWFQPILSNDGRLLLYLAGGLDVDSQQVFIFDSNFESRRQLTNEPEGIREAILSGFGNVAYAFTNSNRLLRIELDTGEARELIPPTPVVLEVGGAPVPGSLNWLKGRGLAPRTETASAPLPQQLGGIQLELNGIPLPLLFVSPELVAYQIPWETPVTDANRLEVSYGDSPFESVLSPVIHGLLPLFLKTRDFATGSDGYRAVAVHEDFSELVTAGNPATIGEVVILYLTGLGEVAPPAITGSPAGLDTLFHTSSAVRCFVTTPGGQQEAEVLFSGLAPGMIGIYQMNLRIPEFASEPTFLTSCGADELSTDLASIPVRR